MTAEQRPVDEVANLLTHGIGFLLSIVASVVMMWIVSGESVQTIAACGVYCATLILLYGASTLSHTFHDLRLRRRFRMLDQACIYVLIAGSFTPIAVLILGHGWWWLILITMWVLALFGVLVVLRLQNLSGAAKITYGLLGWLPAISLAELYRHAPAELLVWMLAGGAFYSVGTIFLFLDRKVRYLHALWHAFVIAGSICHYIAILVCATGDH
ncbi:MAG: hemolysin III family protein [Rhodopirellula sp.]|nr:hemolysin III family protein [Rhodopirellula sp.]